MRLRRMVDDESGMVTIEGAYAISAVVVVVILAVGVITAVTAQIRCADAAREVARLTAVGDDHARAVGEQIVPGAQISVAVQADRVVVDVRRSAPMVPGLTLSARAVAVPEPEGTDQVIIAPGVSR